MNAADTSWMLISTALVLLMTPALAFFYGGLVRSKNALNTMMMSFISLGFVGVLWAVDRVFARAHGRQQLDRRHVAGVPARCRSRRRRHHRAGHHPARALHVLPGHVLHHHGGADLRRDRRADAVFGVCGLHLALGARRLQPDRPLGLGRRLARRHGRARLRRRHRRARERRHRRAGRGHRASASGATSSPRRSCRTTCRSRCSARACSGSAGLASMPAAPSRPARSPRSPSRRPCWRRRERSSSGRCWTPSASSKTTAVGAATGIVVGLVAVTPAAGFIGPMSAIALGAIAAVPSYFGLVWRAKTSARRLARRRRRARRRRNRRRAAHRGVRTESAEWPRRRRAVRQSRPAGRFRRLPYSPTLATAGS